jgi:hypothetical protein
MNSLKEKNEIAFSHSFVEPMKRAFLKVESKRASSFLGALDLILI